MPSNFAWEGDDAPPGVWKHLPELAWNCMRLVRGYGKRGPRGFVYPYGNEHVDGACNEGRARPPGAAKEHLDDPRLAEAPGTIEPTGSFAKCRLRLEIWMVITVSTNFILPMMLPSRCPSHFRLGTFAICRKS